MTAGTQCDTCRVFGPCLAEFATARALVEELPAPEEPSP